MSCRGNLVMETMMKYMLLIYADERAFQALPKAEAERGLAAY